MICDYLQKQHDLGFSVQGVKFSDEALTSQKLWMKEFVKAVAIMALGPKAHEGHGLHRAACLSSMLSTGRCTR